MTSTLQLQRRLRRIVPIIVIVVGLLLVSAVMIQQVAAQDGGGLKPPFKLHKPANLAAPLSGVPPLPLSAPIVMSETFDSGFAYNVRYNHDVSITTVPWHLVDDTGHVEHSYTWGRVDSAPMTDTLWVAKTTPPSASSPIEAGQPYTKNMQAYAIYGPIDMQDYTSAFISITYKMDTLVGDDFGVAFSTNGTDFTMPVGRSGRNPSLSATNTDYYLFPDNTRYQSHVWIALVFTSQDNDNIDALGVFVDEVVLRANPAYKIFMPLIRRDPTPTATPTLTPTPAGYVYNYDFGSGLNTDPQFATWGGKVTDASCYTTDTGGCKWGQDIVTSGHPDGAMTMYQTGLNAIAGASPNNLTPANFELSADFYVIQGKSDARLGLIFNAGNSTFGRSGSTPTFDPDSYMYKFDLQFNESDNTVMSYYRLQRCDNKFSTCSNDVEKSTLPAGLVGNSGSWNTIKIQRYGTNIKVYVNGSLLVNINDGNYVNLYKYGLFLQTKLLNNSTNPLRIRFDNVRVRTLP
ncbi:MAG TPA: hypothetical protein VMP08_08355 [Anaerolineae bacterium]|nr:hypothetical protein [Anaerolineae bacterium]